MKKTKKIIICVIMLVTVIASITIPTFASSYPADNTIIYRGHWYSGLSCNVGDVVMYNGDLYECVYANAVIAPTYVYCWRLYDTSNINKDAIFDEGYNEGVTDGYNEGYELGAFDGAIDGYNNGYTDGYNEGVTDGYNEGVTDGFQDGWEFGVEMGLEEGYTDGYNDGYYEGYDDGVSDGISSIVGENSIGFYEGSTINIYQGGGKQPSYKHLKESFVVSADTPYNSIFNFQDISLIIDADASAEICIEILFPAPVDFITNPLSFRDTKPYDKIEDYTKFMTIKFQDSHDEVAIDGVRVGVNQSYSFYSPGRDTVNESPIDVVRIYFDSRKLISYINKTADGDGGMTPFYLCNNTRQVALATNQMLSNYFQLGYNKGENDGISLGYYDGYSVGYSVGYDAGMVGGDGFRGLFDGIAGVPVTVLSSLLGFEVFGINVMATLCGLLGILLIVWVIKRFI